MSKSSREKWMFITEGLYSHFPILLVSLNINIAKQPDFMKHTAEHVKYSFKKA